MRTPAHRIRLGLGVLLLAVASGAVLGSPSIASASRTPPPNGSIQLARAATGPADDTVPVDPTTTAAAASATVTATPPAPASVALDPIRTPRACRKGLVALTFDDGPARGLTERLLGILQREQVPATFFMVGSRVAGAPATARAVQKAGFGVGNHTWDHANLAPMRMSAIRSELTRTAQELRRVGVTPGPLMRPPYGAESKRVRKVARAMGLAPVLWNVDSQDWKGADQRGIVRSVLGQLVPHRRNLVLQHDGVNNSPASVAAVPKIIARARAKGYCFATLGTDGRPKPPVPVLVAAATGGNETTQTPATVRLTLSEPTDRPVSVHLSTPVSAPLMGIAQPGQDAGAIDTVLTFPVGARSALVTLPVAADGQPEGVEQLTLQLDQGAGLTVAQRSVQVPITDGP